MSKLKFAVAAEDKAAAQAHRETTTITEIEIEGQDYAAVRPVPGAFLVMLNLASQVRAKEIEQVVGVMQFLDLCLDQEAIRRVLREWPTDEFEPTELDGEAYEFNRAGEDLARSRDRLLARWMDAEDDLGVTTLVDVMFSLAEGWSADPTGSPSDSSPSRKRTGARSTAKRSSPASTSSKSSRKAPVASAPRSTASRRAASTK